MHLYLSGAETYADPVTEPIGPNLRPIGAQPLPCPGVIMPSGEIHPLTDAMWLKLGKALGFGEDLAKETLKALQPEPVPPATGD